MSYYPYTKERRERRLAQIIPKEASVSRRVIFSNEPRLCFKIFFILKNVHKDTRHIQYTAASLCVGVDARVECLVGLGLVVHETPK